jgi:HK97 family phage prohead protease
MESNVMTREDAEAQSVALRARYADQTRDGTSYSDLQDMLNTACSEKFLDSKDDDDYLYVCDFDDDSAVFSHNGEKQQAPYSVDGNTVTLGKASLVKAVTSYVPIETKSAEPEPDLIPAVPKKHWSLREIEQPVIGEMSIRMAEGDTPAEAVLVGWPSTTGVGYEVTDWLGEYRETINAGAFGKTLKESDYVPLLVDHRGDVLASWHQDSNRTMDLAEDHKGLRHEARLDIGGNSSSRNLVSGVGRGDYSKESFAFRATKEDWNVDYTERGVNELQLFDVSVVKSPANKTTSVGLRSDMKDILGREGVGLITNTRDLFTVYLQDRSIVEPTFTAWEDTMRAIRAVDERMLNSGQYMYSSRARTFVVVDLIQQIRAGKTLSSANESLLKSALESLSQSDNDLKTLDASHSEAERAISTVLNTTDPNDTNNSGGKASNTSGMDAGKLNDGNPVNPSDGAGTRAATRIRIAQAQLDLMKARSKK